MVKTVVINIPFFFSFVFLISPCACLFHFSLRFPIPTCVHDPSMNATTAVTVPSSVAAAAAAAAVGINIKTLILRQCLITT